MSSPPSKKLPTDSVAAPVAGDPHNTATARGPLFQRRFSVSVSLIVLVVIAAGWALKIMAAILIPIAFAIFFSLMLSPVADRLKKVGLPSALASAAIVLVLLGTMGFGVLQFWEPASTWMEKAPTTLSELERRIGDLKSPLSEIQKLSEKVEQIADVADERQSDDRGVMVKVKEPALLTRVTDSLPTLLSSVAIVVFLTYFLLATENNFLRRLVALGRTLDQRKRVLRTTRLIQSDVFRYLGAITVINTLLGLAVYAIMAMLGVPSPLLWGVVAAVLNFIPYLGPAAMFVVLFTVGILNFPTLSEAFYLPLIYGLINIVESQLVTPAVLGRRLAMSPVVIFISVVFWAWMWGIAGAFLAVPLLMSLKILFDQFPRLQPVAALIDR